MTRQRASASADLSFVVRPSFNCRMGYGPAFAESRGRASAEPANAPARIRPARRLSFTQPRPHRPTSTLALAAGAAQRSPAPMRAKAVPPPPCGGATPIPCLTRMLLRLPAVTSAGSPALWYLSGQVYTSICSGARTGISNSLKDDLGPGWLRVRPGSKRRGIGALRGSGLVRSRRGRAAAAM